MRALDRGERFTVTRNGVAVGELAPIGRRRRVSAEGLLDTSVLVSPAESATLTRMSPAPSPG